MSSNEMLRQAKAVLKEHAAHLKALRKTGRKKTTAKLAPAYPHAVGTLSRTKRTKPRVSETGLQFILLENGRAVGTMSFVRKGKGLKFSHFSFNKQNSQTLLSHIRFAIRKLKLPAHQLLQVVTAAPLATPAIRLETESGVLYLEIDAVKKDALIPEETFIHNQDTYLAELQRGDAEFRQQKDETKEKKLATLRKLNYL